MAMLRIVLLSLLVVCGLGVVVSTQVQLDVCGCKNNAASLGNFDTLNAATYPPGTYGGYSYLVLSPPPDGVMVFNSMNFAPRPGDPGYLSVYFANIANAPVTLLVRGDVTIQQNTYLRLTGGNGTQANSNTLGKGGYGANGGFPGGDGAYQLVNFAACGGSGLGPRGGAGGDSNYYNGGNGKSATFLGAPDLLPLVGGSGGGGGASTSAAASCSGGGGGGGGGALLIAANGTITLDGQIIADGGSGGGMGNGTCASGGGGGSGGAVRLLATTISGSGSVFARGAAGGQSGSIRMEALNNNFLVSATDPLATRAPGPGPIVNPVTPTVAITSVGGQPVPAQPQGVFGGIDLVLAAPGQTDVALSTSGVPSGTTVDVTVKPRVGTAPVTTTPVTLTNCDPSAACLANVTFNLAAGAYSVEARATFKTPTP